MIEDPYNHPLLIFDFPDASGEASRLCLSAPRRVIIASSLGEVIPALHEVENEVNSGATAAGFIAYEAASAFDPALKTPPPSELPLLWFGIFDTPSPLPETTDSDETYPLYWEPNRTKEQYRSHFLQIKEALRSGESYQVNYAMRLRSLFTGDSLSPFTNECETIRAAPTAPILTSEGSKFSLARRSFFSSDAALESKRSR